MATSSRYIQLSSSILLEYIYADQSQINVPSNEFRLSTSTTPIWKMENTITKIPQIFNSDSSGNLIIGSPLGTANVRNNSFASISNFKGALLDIDKITVYNDYAANLTNTSSLPIVFNDPQSPVYDTIKLHLVQGFNFEGNLGFIFTIDIERLSKGKLNLLNLVYNKTNTWETLNPSPFFFGGKVYASYIEVRVLSSFNLIADYWTGVLTGDTVVERITSNNGLKQDQLIQTSFSWMKEKTKIDEQDYITFYDGIEVDLPLKDQFSTISAVIKESSGGDYIEFYGAYNGIIIEDFITDLNRSGYDFILLHDLSVSEYVYDGVSGYNWIVSDKLEISQTNDYDLPNVYRPVIKNASTISYKIDYIIRLFDRSTNTQIWKTSSFLSNSPAKYGRKLQSINLGSNPVQTKIYNKKVIKEITINRLDTPIINNTKYVTSFINSNSVSISYQTVNPISSDDSTVPNENQSVIERGGNGKVIYENGLARILIPDSNAYLKFSLYQNGRGGSNEAINVSGLGSFIISFKNNNEEELLIEEVPTTFVDKSSGEIAFRLTKNQSSDILKYSNRSFGLYLNNEQGESSLLYSGKFYSLNEYQELTEKDKLTDYQNQINLSNSLASSSQETIATQQDTINKLLSQAKSTLSAELGSDNRLVILQSTINELNKKIIEINSVVNDTVIQIQKNIGLPQSSTINNTTEFFNNRKSKIEPSDQFFDKTSKNLKTNPKDSKGSNFD